MGVAVSCSIDTTGTIANVKWDEAVTLTNSTGLVLIPESGLEGSYPSLIYSSGSGTSQTTHTISRSDGPDVIYSNEEFTLAYASSFGDIAELDSGTPIGIFLDVPVGNNSVASTDTTPPVVTNVTIESSGRHIVIEFDEAMGIGIDLDDLDAGWSVTGLSLLSDSRNGPFEVETAAWTDSTRTALRLTVNMTAYASEDASGIFLSYSGGNFADESGNLLADIAARAFDTNNSEVVVRENQTSSSAKKFYMWMNQRAYEPKEFYELRRDNPNTTIYRTALWNEQQFWPSDTTDPQAVPYVTSEEVAIPLSYLIDDLSDRSHWDKGSTPHINLGIIRAILRGETSFEPDFRIAKPLYLYDQVWWDPEPGPTWLSYASETYTQEEKDQFYDAMKVINDVTIEETGNNGVPIVWYRFHGEMQGRVNPSNGIDYSGGAPVQAHARKNLSPDDVDDTPLFGERTFYPSGLTWQEVFDKNDFSNSRIDSRFGRHLEAHVLVCYPVAYMMEPDDPDLAGTSAEGISGGLELWKDWVQSMIDNIPEGREIIVLLRSVFKNYQTLQDRGGFAGTDEGTIDEDYWKGMIQFCLDNERVSGIAYFAGGISMTNVFANGTTPQILAEWALELIEPFNEAATTGGSTSTATDGSGDSGGDSDTDTDSGEDTDSGGDTGDESVVVYGEIVEGRAYLTLRGASETQDLRYTVDGTLPTVESELYEGQIELPEVTNNGLEIRTRYFNKEDPSKRSLVTVIRIRSGEEPLSEGDQ